MSARVPGWGGTRWEIRLERARAMYEAHAGPKVIAEPPSEVAADLGRGHSEVPEIAA